MLPNQHPCPSTTTSPITKQKTHPRCLNSQKRPRKNWRRTLLSESLTRLNNEAAPGIDRFFIAWIKIFWRLLKKNLHNAIKTCKEKNMLSQTLSHAVITLIPKGNKCQTVLGNWRPISLSSGFYKIISSAIAHTLKKHSPKSYIHPKRPTCKEDSSAKQLDPSTISNTTL